MLLKFHMFGTHLLLVFPKPAFLQPSPSQVQLGARGHGLVLGSSLVYLPHLVVSRFCQVCCRICNVTTFITFLAPSWPSNHLYRHLPVVCLLLPCVTCLLWSCVPFPSMVKTGAILWPTRPSLVCPPVISSHLTALPSHCSSHTGRFAFLYKWGMFLAPGLWLAFPGPCSSLSPRAWWASCFHQRLRFLEHSA